MAKTSKVNMKQVIGMIQRNSPLKQAIENKAQMDNTKQNNAKKQQEKSESEGIPINKFLFVERGTQSKSSMARGIETQTEGLPRGIFSGTINK